ncbi:hypothetical protein TWF481_011669 [Arthrobotrys musiformis]|uniref:Uncharacterized protein n=1 Tax=Arthrobotrys musiformis TaxID=47236 RepID=A0AAV9VZ48_9PEZI
MSAYSNANKARLETLWGSLVNLQNAIESHPIGTDPSENNNNDIVENNILPSVSVPIQNIFGATSVFSEDNDSKPLPPTLLGLVAKAKAKVKSLTDEIYELGLPSAANKASGLDVAIADITEQNSIPAAAGLGYEPILLDLTGSQTQIQNSVGLNAAFLDEAESNINIDDLEEIQNPNEVAILDVSIDSSPPFDTIGNIANTLGSLYVALAAIEDLKADIQPDFSHRRKEWQLDEFSTEVWATLDAYYKRFKQLRDHSSREKCSQKKGLVNWVFNFKRQGAGPAAPDFAGTIDLGAKLDFEEGNMGLAVAIDEAMQVYEEALYRVFEFIFLADLPQKIKDLEIDGLREDLTMIYDYMAIYEENLRQVEANVKVLDEEWGRIPSAP